MRANLPTTEPQVIARWSRRQAVRADPRAPRWRASVRPPRRPAVRQRRHPHRPRAQQDPQGLHRQVAHDGGVRLAVCPRLGLSRPSDRAEGRPRARPEKGTPVGRGLPARLPRLRGEVRRQPAPGLRAVGRLRFVERALPDDELPLSGGDRACPGPVRRAGYRLQRQEARPLVPALPDRAGRSRGRIRRSHLAVDLRRVSARRVERRRAVRAHPRAGRPARFPSSSGRRRPGRFPSNLAIAFHPDFDYGAYEVDGRAVIVAQELADTVSRTTKRQLGEPIVVVKGSTFEHVNFRHPLVRPPVARRARRLRHARRRHGRRAHAPGSRRRRLSDRRQVRPRHLRSRRAERAVHRRGRASSRE